MHQWINKSQPQSLQNACILLYFSAVITFLFDSGRGYWPLFLLYVVKIGGAVGAYGIANERKWGYQFSVMCALVPFAIDLYIASMYSWKYIVSFSGILREIMQILLATLLLQASSKKYQKIWFK